MPTTIIYKPDSLPSEAQYIEEQYTDQRMNAVLEHALGTALLARKIELDEGKEPVLSPALSKFTGTKCYVQTGYKKYGGAVKGHASLGYFWQVIAPKYNELLRLDPDELSAKKKTFLRERGIEHPNGMTDQVDTLHVATWEALRRKTLVCPSSGSFALGFVETAVHLRHTTIPVKDSKTSTVYHIPILREDEGRVTPFLPIPGRTDLMPPEKLAAISKVALAAKFKTIYWENERRDLDAFIYTLENDGFYCSTNPKSAEEVSDLVKEVVAEKGYPFLIAHQDTLKKMGITLHKDKDILTITSSPMTGGIAGIMVAKLDAMEQLSQDPNLREETTFNQPSAGTTLVASAIVNMLLSNPDRMAESNKRLLKHLYPEVHQRFIEKKLGMQSHLHGCFDTANPRLPKELGYDGVIYKSNEPAVNGLAVCSPTIEEPVRWLKKAAAEPEETRSFEGAKSMLVCPHNMMEIARVMLFAADVEHTKGNAQYPESAGAAGLGGWLHKEVLEERKTAKDVAHFLRSNGVSMKTFEGLVNIDYFIKESKAHGGAMEQFSKEFLQAMDPRTSLASLKPIGPQVFRPVDQRKAMVFLNTGSNGTERYQHYATDIMTTKDILERGTIRARL